MPRRPDGQVATCPEGATWQKAQKGEEMMKKKILIVDDEKDTCEALMEILSDEGFQTFFALSGRSALTILKKRKPDLVLLDIKMPKMDGIEVMRRIQKINKDLVVVMITAYGALNTAKAAMRLGAYDYVTKPFDMKLIKAVVKEALVEKKQ